MTEYKLTPKENYLRAMRGEFPEYLPMWDMFGWGVRSSATAHFIKTLPNGHTVNEFGVESVSVPDAEGGSIPVPGKFILEDITKWRDVIKTPSLEGIDWEAAARRDLKDFDRVNKPVMSHIGGFFLTLVSFMGFENGLCAMYEEPEEVKALFQYLLDYYLKVYKNILYYYKPDVMSMGDDTATKNNPFFSPDMEKELLLPFQKAEADLAHDAGIPIQMHNCGRCEDFVQDWVDIGISAWDPAQTDNDLLGIKEKFGRKMLIVGGWDYSGPVSHPGSSDELLKDELVKYVDTMAPGGGFAYFTRFLGKTGDPEAARKMKIMNDFYYDYARDWYKRNGYV